MKRNKINTFTLLAIVIFFTACVKEMDIGVTEINQEIIFSIGFANDITIISKANDASFKTTFEIGDAIGMFVYKRDREQESSIESNKTYAHNVKMVYDGRSWNSESPIYYTNDGTLLDIYAYYPYIEGAKADALSYDASTVMGTPPLAVSLIGIEKINTSWAIPVLFNQLLSSVHLSIDKEGVPGHDGSLNVYFNGTVGGTYNILTNEISNPMKGMVRMAPIGTLGTNERIYAVLVPPQNIASRETIFSITQIGSGKLAWEAPRLVNLVQEEILKFHITDESQLKEVPKYSKYEQYPRYGTPVGMVIEVYNNGRNGMVISLQDAGTVQWAVNNAANILVNSDDLYDGASNTKKIQALNNWEKDYPAFGLLEEGWYIPSIEEAFPYFKTNIYQINQNLSKIPGGEPIDTRTGYWTSTEASSSAVRQIFIPGGITGPTSKSNYNKVRAFYRF